MNQPEIVSKVRTRSLHLFSFRHGTERKFLRRVRTACLGLLAAALPAAPAVAGPDLGWGTPEQLAVVQSNLHTHRNTIAAYGSDGTAWVFYREDPITSGFAKSEWLRFRYKGPADSDWGVLTYAAPIQGTSDPLVCITGGGPVFAALGDGRAMLVYREWAGQSGASGCNGTGIRVLLLDPKLPNPVESFFRSSITCPGARNPRIATRGNTALVTWTCIPDAPNAGTDSDYWVESNYFDGTNWSGTTTVPEANVVNGIAANASHGTFHTIAKHTVTQPTVVQKFVSNVFVPGTGWSSQAEVLQVPVGSSNGAIGIVSSDDGSVLAGFNIGTSTQNQVRRRDATGSWGQAQSLILANSIGSGFVRLAAAPGGRYAAVWSYYLGIANPLPYGVAGALLSGNSGWTEPVDILGIRSKDFAQGNGGVIGFPNGSFAAHWAYPSDTIAFMGQLYTATAPVGSSCWRAPLDMQELVSISDRTLASGPTGDFVASWIDHRLILLAPHQPMGLIAAGPDGTGGSDACLSGVDTVPDAFSFDPVANATVTTLVSSNAITVQGINSPAAISISSGEYAINGGAFTSDPGTVNNGDSVVVRLFSSDNPSATTTATLTIGGISATFSVATEATSVSSGGGGGCAIGGDGRFDPTLPALAAAGLVFFGLRRFKAGK
jgi:hypothetical protein